MQPYPKAETTSCHSKDNAQKLGTPDYSLSRHLPALTIHDDGHDYSVTPTSLGVCHV